MMARFMARSNSAPAQPAACDSTRDSTLDEDEARRLIIGVKTVHDIRLSHGEPHCLKCFIVKGEARFECVNCGAKWSSFDTKIKLDLFQQKISKKFLRRCEGCKSVAAPRYTSIVDCVSKNNRLRNQNKSEQSLASSVLRQAPHSVVCYVKQYPSSLSETMKDLYVNIDFYLSDNANFIHLVPLKESGQGEDWSKTCEDKLEVFLKSLSKASLPVKPEVVSRLQEFYRSEPSVYVEGQTVLRIGGDSQDVTYLVHGIKTVEKSLRKPCILPY